MTQTKLRLKKTAFSGLMLATALAFQSDALAAASVVPANWNVSPITNGAYREDFEGSTFAWALKGASSNAVDGTQGGASGRSNAWFTTSAKVLQLDTDIAVATNALTGANTIASEDIYVDMRVKFTTMIDPPDASLTNNIRLGVYLSANSNLVAVSGGGITNSAGKLLPDTWYQLTLKMYAGGTTYDIRTNDAVAFAGLSLRGSGTTLTGVGFNGTGRIDELYVSHGDPAYAVKGPTNANPPLPASGTPPSQTEQTQINTWLNGYPLSTELTGLTKDQLSTAYMLNALTNSSGLAVNPAPNFGIQAFDLINTTTLRVTFQLLMSAVADNNGKINGKIRLWGSTDKSSWHQIGDQAQPTFGVDGKTLSPIDFTIAESDRFFHPEIVP